MGRTFLKAFGLCTLAVVTVGCVPAVEYEPLELTMLDGGEARTLDINSQGAWRDTGIQMQRDEVYQVETQGTWSAGGFCGQTDASGLAIEHLACMKGIFAANFPVPSGRIGALVGRIGPSGEPFVIGGTRGFIAKNDGTLYLRMNDPDDFVWDNAGQIQVSINRKASSSAPAQVATAPQTSRAAVAPRPSGLPSTPVNVSFKSAPKRADDIAVIIANADYKKLGQDIPNVAPAYADAAGIRKYVTEALGVREGNVIEVKDATGSQLQRIFGTSDNPQGQLYDWVRPGRSNVFVYYAGHGAPATTGGSALLVPSDSDAARIHLNGYPLERLYANLAKLPAKSVTVVLEACFSGASQAGSVIAKASPVFVRPKAAPVPDNITVIAAGAPDQMASWEPDSKHSLFTSYFLKAQSGEADTKPFGNGDGRVDHAELKRYLEDTLTYFARRHYGRDQTAVIVTGER